MCEDKVHENTNKYMIYCLQEDIQFLFSQYIKDVNKW